MTAPAGEAMARQANRLRAMTIDRRTVLPFRSRAGRSGLRELAGRTHGDGDPLGDALAGVADLLVQEGRLAVGHVAIRQPDAQDARYGSAALVQGLPDRG